MKPEDIELKEIYYKNTKADQLKQTIPVELLKQQGYSMEDIEKIKENIGKDSV
jgi:hypothetical protein